MTDVQSAIVEEDAIRGAPALPIEVLSTTHRERDRIVKLELYARNHVAEYWIVDPEAVGIEVFRLDGDRYAPAGWFTGDVEAVSATLPRLRVPLPRVLG